MWLIYNSYIHTIHHMFSIITNHNIVFSQVQIWQRLPTHVSVWSARSPPCPPYRTGVSPTRACPTPQERLPTRPPPSPTLSASACRPWRPPPAVTTRIYPQPTRGAPPRVRADPSRPARRPITCTTAAPPDRTSSPWCRGEAEASARRPASYRPAPTPPQAPPSCTPPCPIRATWWRPKEATAVRQPACPSKLFGGRIENYMFDRQSGWPIERGQLNYRWFVIGAYWTCFVLHRTAWNLFFFLKKELWIVCIINIVVAIIIIVIIITVVGHHCTTCFDFTTHSLLNCLLIFHVKWTSPCFCTSQTRNEHKNLLACTPVVRLMYIFALLWCAWYCSKIHVNSSWPIDYIHRCFIRFYGSKLSTILEQSNLDNKHS